MDLYNTDKLLMLLLLSDYILIPFSFYYVAWLINSLTFVYLFSRPVQPAHGSLPAAAGAQDAAAGIQPTPVRLPTPVEPKPQKAGWVYD